MEVSLEAIEDEAGLRALLALAVADATPEETMPPFHEPEKGWTEAKQAAFLDFFRAMMSSEESIIFLVRTGSEIAGFTRLKRIEPATAQTGMWLGRTHRGKRLGAATLSALLAEAARRGYQRVVADTTPENLAAQAVLRRGGARARAGDDGKIYAEIAIDPGYATELDK